MSPDSVVWSVPLIACVATSAACALAGLAQFGGLLIWGATLTNRVKMVERDLIPLSIVATLTSRVDMLERDIIPVGGVTIQVARVETRLEVLVDQLRELNGWIRGARDPNDSSHPPTRRAVSPNNESY